MGQFIAYRDLADEVISYEDALHLGDYEKLYYNEKLLEQIELFIDNELESLTIYNNDNESHLTIINRYLSRDLPLSIVDIEMFNYGYRLETTFEFAETNILYSKFLELFNHTGDLVATESQDATGATNFEECKKYYWDRSENALLPVFECTYDEFGIIEHYYFNDDDNDFVGQIHDYLPPTAESEQIIMEVYHLPETLVKYYQIPYARPNF